MAERRAGGGDGRSILGEADDPFGFAGAVRNYQPKAGPQGYRELSRLSGPAMSYHVVRGYWLVRYLEDVHPGFLRQCLAAPKPAHQLEAEVAGELGVEPASFWVKIDDLIVTHGAPALSDLRE